MPTIFRMHGTNHPVFDAMGSFLYAGRWHSQGSRVVYAAEHASLAVLETLVHSGGRKIPARALARIRIPGRVAIESAPWIEFPQSQDFGDAWVRERRCAVLQVPSAAMNKIESNFVLNPAHPDFERIEYLGSEEFHFDPRFFLAGL